MPTPFGCAIDEVYSDWNFKKSSTGVPNEQNSNSNQSLHQHPQLHPIQSQSHSQSHSQQFQQNNDDNNDDVYIPNNNGLKSFCPNCQSCLNANNMLQQRIVEVNTWPRPRWEPQSPNAYVPFDPFNRYWMNNVPPSHREDFGNIFENFGKGGGGNGLSTANLLQIILFILIALFIIQLIECLYARME